jgi:hypothetical protein
MELSPDIRRHHGLSVRKDNTMKLASVLRIIVAYLCLSFGVVRSQWVQSGGPGGAWLSALSVSGENLYAGESIWTGGIFVSSNGGAQWRSCNVVLKDWMVNTIASYNSYVFVGTSEGLYRSVNSGATWEKANKGLTDTSVNCVIANAGVLFTGTYRGGVFRSTDNGDNWTSFGLKGTIVNHLAVVDSFLFAGCHTGMVRSPLDHADWFLDDGSGLAGEISAVAVTGRDLYAARMETVFVSTDLGSSWKARSSGLSSLWISALTVSGDNLYAGTQDGMFRSTNKGMNWIPANAGLAGFVKCFALSGSTVFAGTQGFGVFKSTNNGGSWTPVSSGLKVQYEGTYALASSDGSLFAGTQFGVSVSTNGGWSWSPTNLGMPAISMPTPFCFLFSGTVGFAGTSFGVYRTIDGGSTWQATTAGMGEIAIWCLCIFETKLYAATQDSGVFVSSDNGSSWKDLSAGLPTKYVRCVTVNSNRLFAGTDSGAYILTNDGTSWAITGLRGKIVDAFTVRNGALYAGTSHCVFASTDNGTNWNPAGTGLNYRVMNFANYGTNIFAATYDGVFLCTDGSTWSRVDSGLVEGLVWSIAVHGSVLFAGTEYYGVWMRDLSQMVTSVEMNPKVVPSSFSLAQNYPNPFNPKTVVSFQSPVAGKIRIVVYDLLGREVAVLVDGETEAGRHDVTFDGTALASGIYLCRMNSGDFTAVRKLLLIR